MSSLNEFVSFIIYVSLSFCILYITYNKIHFTVKIIISSLRPTRTARALYIFYIILTPTHKNIKLFIAFSPGDFFSPS